MLGLLLCSQNHNIDQTINYLLCSQSMKLYSAFEMVFDVPIRPCEGENGLFTVLLWPILILVCQHKKNM